MVKSEKLSRIFIRFLVKFYMTKYCRLAVQGVNKINRTHSMSRIL